VLVAVWVGTACGQADEAGDRAEESDLQVIVGATNGAETARFESVMVEGEYSMTMAGVVDFAANVGEATLVSANAPADVAPDFVPERYVLRWIGGTVYFKFEFEPGSEPADGLVGDMFAGKWMKAPMGIDAENCTGTGPDSFFSAMTGLPDGADVEGAFIGVLERLEEFGATLDEQGSEEVRGEDTTRWRVIMSSPPPSTTVPPGCDGEWDELDDTTVTGREIWTDADDRMRRVRVSRTADSSMFPEEDEVEPSSVTQTMTTEFFDFGVEVHVEAPPPSDVFDPDDMNGLLEDSGEAVPDGPAAQIEAAEDAGTVDPASWKSIASGTLGGQPWTLWRATSSKGWPCYEGQGIPGGETWSVVDSGDIEHEGRPVFCMPDSTMAFLDFQLFFSQADGDEWDLLGVSMKPDQPVTLQLFDGTSVELTPDPATGAVQWTGRVANPPQRISLDQFTCQPTMMFPESDADDDFSTGGMPCLGPWVMSAMESIDD
jgi:hypothetical protein